MSPVLGIILFVAAIAAVMKWIVNPIIAKRDERSRQKAVDQNVEWQINECKFNEVTIEVLAKHSDKERMARIASTRLVDYIAVGTHPKQLAYMLEKLGLFTATRNNWGAKEIELSALIQQYTLRNLDTHDMRVYQSITCEDRKTGFEKLNKSFLTKVHDNMLVWSPLN